MWKLLLTAQKLIARCREGHHDNSQSRLFSHWLATTQRAHPAHMRGRMWRARPERGEHAALAGTLSAPRAFHHLRRKECATRLALSPLSHAGTPQWDEIWTLRSFNLPTRDDLRLRKMDLKEPPFVQETIAPSFVLFLTLWHSGRYVAKHAQSFLFHTRSCFGICCSWVRFTGRRVFRGACVDGDFSTRFDLQPGWVGTKFYGKCRSGFCETPYWWTTNHRSPWTLSFIRECRFGECSWESSRGLYSRGSGALWWWHEEAWSGICWRIGGLTSERQVVICTADNLGIFEIDVGGPLQIVKAFCRDSSVYLSKRLSGGTSTEVSYHRASLG